MDFLTKQEKIDLKALLIDFNGKIVAIKETPIYREDRSNIKKR